MKVNRITFDRIRRSPYKVPKKIKLKGRPLERLQEDIDIVSWKGPPPSPPPARTIHQENWFDSLMSKTLKQ